MEFRTYPDPTALAQAAAGYFSSLTQTVIAKNGIFRVALAGGNTPRLLYQRLAQPPYLEGLDWENMHIFWGDERCVPPEHPESNYSLAYHTLFKHTSLPGRNLHRILGELSPEQAAAAYRTDLEDAFGNRLPDFDLMLLGLGEDGHTASLFPGAPALQEQDRWAVAVEHTTPPLPLLPRVTLTLPVLNASHHVVFLISGTAKAETVARLQADWSGPLSNPDLIPAGRIRPAGKLVCLLDHPAAAFLSKV